MSIRWDKVFENEKRQFEKMNEADKFVYFLLLQFGSPYVWGKETRNRPIVRGRCAWRCMRLRGC
jgi:hypothetical protein